MIDFTVLSLICFPSFSLPIGHSVNDGISPELSLLQYAKVDNAVDIIRKLGRGTQLVKLDIKDAYRIVPVHLADYHLLGIEWRGFTYIDWALPFKLRSAPKVFNVVADLIAWVLACKGVNCQLRYLDDFLLIVAHHSQLGHEFLAITPQTLAWLGVPVATHKTEGSTTTLVFLGILIDTNNFELQLLTEKLIRLQQMIQHWVLRHTCTRPKLESLLGHLSHTATVISQGRVFLRQLFPLLFAKQGTIPLPQSQCWG